MLKGYISKGHGRDSVVSEGKQIDKENSGLHLARIPIICDKFHSSQL